MIKVRIDDNYRSIEAAFRISSSFFVSLRLIGERSWYNDLGDPCAGDTEGTSFFSQFTCVLKLPNTDQYIAMADRWKPLSHQQKFGLKYLKTVERAMSGDRHADITVPDRSPRVAGRLSGKLIHHPMNTSIARYVWLPIEWEGEKPVIRWKDEWKTGMH